MAVVISDFEVVVEAPPADAPAPALSQDTAPSATVLTPHEVELLLDRQAERAERVRAH
jgi:hypothetical protein